MEERIYTEQDLKNAFEAGALQCAQHVSYKCMGVGPKIGMPKFEAWKESCTRINYIVEGRVVAGFRTFNSNKKV